MKSRYKLGPSRRAAVHRAWFRNGAAVVCVYCAVPLTRKTVSVDHILPLARGGTHDRSNLQPTCHECNQEKRSLTDAEYRALKGLS